MPRNEEGEFELVLGNRQLLSVFFIVVVLLGVFFVMGYILGKNASPAPAAEITSARKPADSGPAADPLVIDKTGTKPSATPDPPVTERKVESEPVRKTEAQTETKADTKTETKAEKKAETPKKTPPPAPMEDPRPVATAGASKAGEPPKGSLFLQVAAVGRAEADVVAKVLRGKGYNLWIAPTDKEKVFRVLVGPIQRAELGKIRGELTGLGFNPFPRSY